VKLPSHAYLPMVDRRKIPLPERMQEWLARQAGNQDAQDDQDAADEPEEQQQPAAAAVDDTAELVTATRSLDLGGITADDDLDLDDEPVDPAVAAEPISDLDDDLEDAKDVS
jgi:hypothetical protein